jgi:TFIIF-interacting CTD phosphatase-like protein
LGVGDIVAAGEDENAENQKNDLACYQQLVLQLDPTVIYPAFRYSAALEMLLELHTNVKKQASQGVQ